MTTTGHVRHLVIGAGFAGLGTAIRLDEDGETDFLVIEKGTGVGGTWRDNTYPGAACDVPSQLYSFSFAPNPDWSSSFSPQPEIHAYLRRVAAESGVLDRFRFGTAVEHAEWDDAAQQWRVSLSDGGEVTATTLISGAGGLSEPKLPDIDGLDGVPGRGLPLRPLEPRRGPARQAGGGHRHRRLGDPDRARAPEGGRPRRRLPAHRAVRPAARRPRVHPAREARVPAPAAGAEGLPDRDLLGPRAAGPGLHGEREAGAAGQEAGAAQHPRRASPTRRCGPRSPPTSRSAASAS